MQHQQSWIETGTPSKPKDYRFCCLPPVNGWGIGSSKYCIGAASSGSRREWRQYVEAYKNIDSNSVYAAFGSARSARAALWRPTGFRGGRTRILWLRLWLLQSVLLSGIWLCLRPARQYGRSE